MELSNIAGGVNFGVETTEETHVTIPDNGLKVISGVSYLDILGYAPDFFSLDISAASTGWVRWVDKKLEFGAYTLQSTDNYDRRHEFADFLKSTFGGHHYEHIFIEDVYGGQNFKTVQLLIQLNTIADDLVHEGYLDAGDIRRLDNGRWKKFLRKAANYKAVLKGEHDKEMIRNALHQLGFTEDVVQDIYDALGLAVGIIKRDYIDVNCKPVTKQKADIRKGWKLKQFFEEDDAVAYANEVGREVFLQDCTKDPYDLAYHFKRLVKEYGDDKVIILGVRGDKLGVLALTHELDTDCEETYIVAVRKG